GCFKSLKTCRIEVMYVRISLLSIPAPVPPEAIENGRLGLLLLNPAQRRHLLPKVATEHRLTREQFLEETSRKAGLPRCAWKDAETRIFGFTCEVFADDSPTPKV